MTAGLTPAAHSLAPRAPSDDGIGIAQEKLDLIFAPFAQVDQYSSREYQGVGLGLSISLRLATKMGGQLTCTSAGLGKGSTFTLILPAVTPTVASDGSSIDIGSGLTPGNSLQGLRQKHSDRGVPPPLTVSPALSGAPARRSPSLRRCAFARFHSTPLLDSKRHGSQAAPDTGESLTGVCH